MQYPNGYPTEADLQDLLEEATPEAFEMTAQLRGRAPQAPQQAARRGALAPPQGKAHKPRRRWATPLLAGLLWLAQALIFVGFTAGIGFTDGPLTYWGVEGLAKLREAKLGAGPVPVWVLLAVTAALTAGANGTQWYTALKYGSWAADYKTIVQFSPFLLLTAVLAGLQAAISSLGGYIVADGLPMTSEEVSEGIAAGSVVWAVFFGLAVQWVLMRRIVTTAEAEAAEAEALEELDPEEAEDGY